MGASGISGVAFQPEEIFFHVEKLFPTLAKDSDLGLGKEFSDQLSLPQKMAVACIRNGMAGIRGLALQSGGGKARRAANMKKREDLAKEDRAWFTSEQDDTCSFIWCCEVLGISASYLRKYILPLFMTARHKRRKS